MGGFCLLLELHREGSALQPAQQAFWLSCYFYFLFPLTPVLLPARSAVTGKPSWQRALLSILGSKALLLVAKLDILDRNINTSKDSAREVPEYFCSSAIVELMP